MVRLLICVNILRLSHFRTCLWHFVTTSNVAYTSVSLFCVRVYVFGCACPQTPFNVIFILKTRTWNSTTILMNFHDDFHPPDPNQRQICKKLWTESFSHLPWGRTGHARKWIRFDDIDWGQGERIKKTLSPTVRSFDTVSPIFQSVS